MIASNIISDISIEFCDLKNLYLQFRIGKITAFKELRILGVKGVKKGLMHPQQWLK